jgi:hypothetical protein
MGALMLLAKSCLYVIASACCATAALASGLRGQDGTTRFRGGDPRLTEPALEEMTKAWIFCEGQALAIAKLQSDFPEMANRFELAQRKFEAQFRPACNSIELLLERETGKWTQLRVDLRSRLEREMAALVHDQDGATMMLDLLDRRTRGEDIDSPTIEALLYSHPRYRATPSRELLDGFKVRFASDGKGKAKGVKFHLDHPQSWAAKEGDRPNIVRKFMSENGRGLEMAMVIVKTLPAEAHGISDEEWAQEFRRMASSGELAEDLPAGFVYVEGAYHGLDGAPGYVRKLRGSQKRIDGMLFSVMLEYTCCWNGRFIGLHFSTAVGHPPDAVVDAEVEAKRAEERFQHWKPLFHAMAGKFVIDSKWE